MKFALKFALLLGVAAPAIASDKQDFVQCDGRLQPGKQDDGMRGIAPTSPYSFATQLGTGSIAACTRALASPRLLPTQSIRRANLLRARAAAYLTANDTAKAVADIDAAVEAVPDRATDSFYQRSMGVSLTLLRALAAGRSGDFATAVPLARKAMEARPYALQVQQIGAQIIQASRAPLAPSPSPWPTTVRLFPDAVPSAILSETDVGNYKAVLAMRPLIELRWPSGPLQAFALDRGPEGSKLIQSIVVGTATAYARAATGDPAGARRDLAEIKAKMAEVKVAPIVLPKGLSALGTPTNVLDGIEKFLETRSRQIEARIAVAEGRHGDAIAALIAAPLPNDGSTIELLTALKAGIAPKDAGLVPDPAPFREAFAKQRRDGLARLADDALIAPETPRAVIDYEKARPNVLGALVGAALSMGTTLLGGVGRTDGFRSTPNADGTIKVEFIGNTTSAPLVQEMTLLRAAEVTREAGKRGFVITERKDYTRSLQTTQYGSVISSVPTGFKTELTIRPLDTAPDPARMLDATAVIDALGPLYYEAAPAKH